MCAISSSSPSLHAAPGSSSRSCSSPPAAASAGTSAASLDFQPPYFPPPTASQLSSLSQLSSQLSQEQQQMFSQLPVSLASLQPLPSLVPAPAPALSDTFHSVQTGLAGRRLTQDSGSPLSLVRPRPGHLSVHYNCHCPGGLHVPRPRARTLLVRGRRGAARAAGTAGEKLGGLPGLGERAPLLPAPRPGEPRAV